MHQTLCLFRVEQLLKERSGKAQAIANVYTFVKQFLLNASGENIFQVSYLQVFYLFM